MAKAKSDTKKIWIIRVVVAAVLIAALALSLIWTDAINEKLGLVGVKESAYGGNSLDTALAGGTATEDDVGKDLNVHFVDVGQGDACIIEFPDERTMLIDAAKAKDRDKLLTYIENNIKGSDGNTIAYFDYAILTHPDEDHCGGMGEVLTKYPAKTFYRPNVAATYDKNDFKDPLADQIIAATNDSKYNKKDTKAYDAAIEAGYNLSRKTGSKPPCISPTRP
ncbi:MAG: MBL fold metallo-hydrolase, partial [Clostridiales bacterium]|nr:MBL fold metallo-hydrolase [Clostridiales bacterium]